MPRTDRLTLDFAGWNMPGVDQMSNKSSLNVNLDRVLRRVPSGLPSDRSLIGLFTNFVRLTDKGLREYDAARAELELHLTPHKGLRVSPILRAIDHMENCVSATYRAVLNAESLQANKIGRSGPRLTALQRERLKRVRDAIEHSDEKLLGVTKSKVSPPFTAGEPYSLRLANTSMVIGQHALTYKGLVSALGKMHRTIEVIRGVPSGDPGPNWVNARLRTDPGAPAQAQSDTFRPSDYLKELSRLRVTH